MTQTSKNENQSAGSRGDGRARAGAVPGSVGRILEGFLGSILASKIVLVGTSLGGVVTLLLAVVLSNSSLASAFVGFATAVAVLLAARLLRVLARLRQSSQEAIDEMASQLNEAHHRIRGLERERRDTAETLTGALRQQEAENIRTADQRDKAIRDKERAEKKRKETRDENLDLRRRAEAAEIELRHGRAAMVAIDVRNGWEENPELFRADLPLEDRIFHFFESKLLPGLREVEPELRSAGMTLISRESGRYHLISDYGGPRVLRAIGSPRASHDLSECFERLGIPDWCTADVPIPGRAEWLTVFAPFEAREACEYLIGAAARLIGETSRAA